MTRARVLADYVSSGDELAVTTATADAALPKAGGAMTGAVTTNSTFDGRDVAADGVTADAALPKAGGAMTGAITTNSTFDGVDIAVRDAIHAPKASPTFTGFATAPSLVLTPTGTAPTGGNAIKGALYYDSNLNSLMQHNGTSWTAGQGNYTLEYLVIGGGGSGGGHYRAGGGGAGGYRNSYASETSGRNSSTETPWLTSTGAVLTVAVGAGGAIPTNAVGNRGVDSSITASGQTTVTSYGGGGGGIYSGGTAVAGTYGSGAGAGHGDNITPLGSDGTTGQGFDGGDMTSSGHQQGAGGGGAGGGGDAGGTTSDLQGGNGLSSSITGSAVTRAGGGGGGSYGTGGYSSGGSGGGGNGGSTTAGDPHSGVADGSYFQPLAGTEPTSGNGYVAGGGGGGLSGQNSAGTYGKGATGIVILRMATVNYSGITTGSPVVSTTGTDTVLVFTGNGSYTT